MPLSAFIPPIQTWFKKSFKQPTPPQVQGWGPIQQGEHTLILAPTGSGKTLTAFLWGINDLFYRLQHEPKETKKNKNKGIQLLYISPLKALNNDIERNLRRPLAGIRAEGEAMEIELPFIEVAVRSGDTPQRERQAMLRRPPHILITTPESFYLMLTAPKARDLFKTVRTVIVDEIHTLAGQKRGVHLSLSLERLQNLAQQSVQRIGLSATIQPLDEVARFLGGNDYQEEGDNVSLHPRPVSVVDAAYKKDLRLKVQTITADFKHLPGQSIWPTLIPQVLKLIRQHKTTLIFANNRRQAEQVADRLNEQIAAEAVGKTSGLLADGVVKGIGMTATGTGSTSGPIRVHHGSIAKETRLALENDLKAGRLPALVGTSSLELGIDIGSIDLVIQLQSPKSVAQGLQRIGRSGHLVGQTSRGRIFPTHREDVMEAAAIAGGMLRGEVEPTYTPRNPLDILAQQIVAMVSLKPWPVEALYNVIRGAYAYEDLTSRVYQAVLAMLSGRYSSLKQATEPKSASGNSFMAPHRALRPRLAWDRINNKLAALPGSRLLALTNGGTIPDRGTFTAYLGDGKTKVGELDEEFVYETRIGDALMLGSQVWRVIDVDDDRLRVVEASGATPKMPFWRGDYPWRPYQLGVRVGAFRRAIVNQLTILKQSLQADNFNLILKHPQDLAVQKAVLWLKTDYALDEASAWQVLSYVVHQLDRVGAISSDKTIIVEVFEDSLGNPRMVIQSPFGGRVNGPWGLALAGAIRKQLGVDVEVQTNDDGILFRLPDTEDSFPLDLVQRIGPQQAREYILQELPDSAVFGAHFRQNAARALLLTGAGLGKRTPFWLQRLRAKDLLQVVRRFDDFPIVAETYRNCLEDVLDLPHLETVLGAIQRGSIEVILYETETPSPVAQSLLWDFISIYMYRWDTPKAERQLQTLALNRDLLQDLLKDVALDELLKPEAVAAIKERLQYTAPTAQVRTAEELSVLLQQLGDLSTSEIADRATLDPAAWISQLSGQQRIVSIPIPTAQGSVERWILSDYLSEYQRAFNLPTLPTSSSLPSFEISNSEISNAETGNAETGNAEIGNPTHINNNLATVDESRRRILTRFLAHAGPITLSAIQARYAFPSDWLQTELEQLLQDRHLAHGRFTPRPSTDSAPITEDEFIDRQTLEKIHRRTLTLLRQEVKPVPFSTYAHFLARWQHLHPATRLNGSAGLTQVLQQLRFAPIVGKIWERDVLPLRLTEYKRKDLTALAQSGELIWLASGGTDPRRSRIRFLFRGEGQAFLEQVPTDMSIFSQAAQTVYHFLQSEGAIFFADLRTALDMDASIAESALLELVLAGLVTNDSLDTMRQIVEQGHTENLTVATEQRAVSSLEAELAARLSNRKTRPTARRRPSRAKLQAARQRVEAKLAAEFETPWVGRWSLVHRFSVLGKAIPLEAQVAQQTRQLLARHGLVTHQSLENELGAWSWGLIYQKLKQLEMRGEVRRGYFVSGLAGMQFALPDAVEQLRAARDLSQSTNETDNSPTLIILNACDPANCYGPTLPDGPQTEAGKPLSFVRVPSTWVVQHRGFPLLVATDTAKRLITMAGVDEGLLLAALKVLCGHLAKFESHLTVEQWNDDPILNSVGRSLLESVGFYRAYPAMRWDKKRI